MTPHFNYHEGRLRCEQVDLDDIANAVGTPTYVYSRATIENNFKDYQRALSGHRHLICYAVKANSNLAVINLLAELGAGFDIVSGGELARVIAAGGDPGKIVFSGVCKAPEAMKAALEAGIRCFNVESAAELETLSEVAKSLGKIAPISLRVNPDVNANTHPYISTGLKENKFGVDISEAPAIYRRAIELPGVNPVGLDCHIGSQLTDISPFTEALDRLLNVLDDIEALGIEIEHLDLGGGLGVCYADENVPSIGDYIGALVQRLGNRDIELIFEPGRSIVAMAGVLLTRVNYLKCTPHQNFALVDAAMNDLIRPALYGAWQDIIATQPHAGEAKIWDVVGPVCETGDFLGKARNLTLETNDLLAVTGAGAYGFSMASNYNTRPRAAEVMVDGAEMHLVRRREKLETLWQDESILPGVAC